MKEINQLQKNEIYKVKGLNGCGLAFFLAETRIQSNEKIVVILENESEFPYLIDDIKAMGEYINLRKNKKTVVNNVERFVDNEIKVYEFPQMDSVLRIKTLYKLINNESDIILTTKNAIEKKTINKQNFTIIHLTIGMDFGLTKLIDALIKLGYERTDFVEQETEFSTRGEIVDLWSPQDESPKRIVFMENKIETISEFDVFTQRTKKYLTETEIIPAKEKEEESMLNYFAEEPTVLLHNTHPQLKTRKTIIYDEFLPIAHDFGFIQQHRYQSNLQIWKKDFLKYINSGYEVVIFCKTDAEFERLNNLLLEEDLPIPTIIISNLSKGTINHMRKLVFFTYREIFLKEEKSIKLPQYKVFKKLETLWEINKGDYVVHETYGIGKYIGLKKINFADYETEFLTLQYKGGDILYVPIYDFKKVQKYIGIEGKKPRLYSLDVITWERTKRRVKEAAQALAKQLFEIYTNRRNIYRHPYQQDDLMEKELQSSFIYNETQDQIQAINDVKQDMYKTYPMDRLILGDVGYGKTEVAVRAAFKAVLSNQQVAFICPTTILAYQHYHTFLQRLSRFPVNISLLTRFQQKKEQKRILTDTINGVIDILIGTHRILQDDVKFRNLGLLIIDDEHKFGVKQKEKLKTLKKNIDTLSLTATPIPRTLSMALSGIKDISLIETPPEGRLPIKTFISPYNEEIVKNSINYELNRSGQVFYLYNRIETINHKLQKLKSLCPNANFQILHAKMPSKKIEKIMIDFINKKIDCLISTTIIEAGIDIPNANTMIIEHAEEFGLAQLYQLRGRIGRSTTDAYCYLFYSPGNLTEGAKKRLQALYEFSKLSSAFKLALRDLEIRGAGDILGTKQHGFIRDVGLELYSKMLSEEINILKKTPKIEEIEPEIELKINAYLPENYIPYDDLRIYFYRKINSSKTVEELKEINEELTDRFGRPPQQALDLLDIAELKIYLKKINAKKIRQTKEYIQIELPERILKLNQTDIKKIKEAITRQFNISL